MDITVGKSGLTFSSSKTEDYIKFIVPGSI